MRKWGIVGALLGSLMLSAPASAQSHAGVNFGGSTFIWAPNLDDGTTPGHSSQGSFSYWYASSQFAIATIFATYPYYPSLQTFAPGIVVQHQLVGNQVRLHLYLTDGGQANTQEWYGLTPLPQDGLQHHVSFIVDTGQIRALWSLDGVQQPWDTSLNHYTGAVFDMPANSSGWTLGAWRNPISGNGQNYYHGCLAEVYGHMYPSDYDQLSTPRPGARGFAQFRPIPGTSNAVFGPLDLGPGCSNIFGAAASPLICQRGNSTQFLTASAGSFVTYGPALTDCATNPFDLIP